MSLATEIAKLRAKQAAAAGNVEQNYRGVPGLVNATAAMPNFGGAPRPVTGVINPGGMPPENASPPPATGGSLLDAIRDLAGNSTSLGPVANNGSLPNIGMSRLPRARAEFGMPPSTGVVSNPLLLPDPNSPFMPGESNPFGFASPEVFYGNQPSIGGPILGGNLPPAVGFGGTAETGYITPFAPPAVGFGNPNFGLFGQPLMSNGMTQFRGNVGFPASNTYGQGLGQIGRGLFGQQPNMNQFYNMNANQGMGQSLGSMGSQAFGGQFNNMQPQMAMQQFSQQGPPPAFSDSFAYRPL
jgi:hypothetical protein